MFRIIYLTVGALSCAVFAAVGAANVSVNFGVLMAWTAFLVLLALLALHSAIKASVNPFVIGAAGVGLVACFWVIGAVSNAVIHGTPLSLSMQAQGELWWALPLAGVIWTALEIYRRKRQL